MGLLESECRERTRSTSAKIFLSLAVLNQCFLKSHLDSHLPCTRFPAVHHETLRRFSCWATADTWWHNMGISPFKYIVMHIVETI